MRPVIIWCLIITCSALLIGATFYFGRGPDAWAPPALVFDTSTPATTDAAAKPQASPPRTPPAGYREYRNSNYGFSIFYPENLPPTEFRDRGYALTVSFQSEAGKEGFQIYVAPINGTKVDAYRFRLDAPSGVKKNEKQTTVDGAQAIAFEGLSYEIGATHEIWFIHGDPARPDDGRSGGFLFEVTTYKELDTWLDALLASWKFM